MSSAGLRRTLPPQTMQPPSRSTTRRIAARSSATGAMTSMVSAVPAGDVIAREDVFGMFSAFVVALFAEMYGFPLTLYVLGGWLSANYPQVNWLSHDAGHLLEMWFGWRANPHFGPFHIASFVFIGLWGGAGRGKVVVPADTVRRGRRAQRQLSAGELAQP